METSLPLAGIKVPQPPKKSSDPVADCFRIVETEFVKSWTSTDINLTFTDVVSNELIEKKLLISRKQAPEQF